MPQVVPIVLWSWVPITLILFRKLPPRRAAIACLIGGWLLLPTARFADSVGLEKFPFWIMPSSVASDVWTTKARVIGIACLVGLMAFDPSCWRRFRPSIWDLPMLAWCGSPILSGLTNNVFITEFLADVAYMGLSWGVPYLVGRIYFADASGLDELARGIVIGGLACLPACLFEFLAGPIIYANLYGFHPYREPGATRYVGFRPILFFEDGNQLGTWLATSALVAAWLWRSGSFRSLGKVPGWLVAIILIAQAFLAQSVGAVLLLVFGLICMELSHRADRLWPVALPAFLAIAFLGVRATNLVDAKALAMRGAAGREVVRVLTGSDRGSIGWRLRIEERGARLALKRPLLGWARWDWWREVGMRPWGLPGLALGMYGLAGWTVLMSVYATPGLRFLGLGSPATWTLPYRASAAALAGAWALNVSDSVLNAALILPMVAVAGGLVGLGRNAARASAWIDGATMTGRRPT